MIFRSLFHQKVGHAQSLMSKFNIQSLLRPKHELKLGYISGTLLFQKQCVMIINVLLLGTHGF